MVLTYDGAFTQEINTFIHWSEVVKWIKHLSPEGLEVRIPDHPVTLMIDGNQLVTMPDRMRWFHAISSIKNNIAGPFSHVVGPGGFGTWSSYCIHAPSIS